MGTYQTLLAHVNALCKQGEYTAALSAIAAALELFPDQAIELAVFAYDIAQAMPDKSRYAQYQSRYFDFGVQPGDKVLDMGSGHIPFPLATHLADIALEDHTVGRAGVPFKHVDGKPVYECSVEKTPFGDKEFDFVYCSHVLEHVHDPEAACRELMRIGKRGYIECPKPGKDAFYLTAKQSNHIWGVNCINGGLRFTEYTEADLLGVKTSILVDMTCAPRTKREKAVAAFEYIAPESLNVMLLWNGPFDIEIIRTSAAPATVTLPCRVRLEKMSEMKGLVCAEPLLTKIRRKIAGIFFAVAWKIDAW